MNTEIFMEMDFEIDFEGYSMYLMMVFIDRLVLVARLIDLILVRDEIICS